jgi:hypothetical protein
LDFILLISTTAFLPFTSSQGFTSSREKSLYESESAFPLSMGNILEEIRNATGKVVGRNVLIGPCERGAGDAPVETQFFGSPEGNDGGVPGRGAQGWREFADAGGVVK